VAGPSPPLLALEVRPWDGGEGPRVVTSRAFEIAVASRGVTAITGPNGSGKSVILAAAAGWSMTPQAKARWSRPPSPPPIMATQYPESQLFEEVVRDELVWAAASRGLDRARALEVSAGYLEALGIDPRRFLSRRAWSLSGGEKRIAGIVGTLVAPAALRVLDEPTAGLDPARRSALGALLRRISTSDPVLLASQDLAWASALASRAFEVGERGSAGAPSPSKKTD
jgi:energy-coupling factor transport system ATP-binding protein